MASPFSIVPVEVCMDSRLTKMQLRVLIALLSFRNKNTDTVWPKREQIALKCGYAITVISRVTTQLVELGWLEKVGKGGFSKSSEYRITVPNLVTVDGATTVTGSVTEDSASEANNSDQIGNGNQFGNGNQTSTNNSDHSGTSTVTTPVTGNKQTNNRPITDHIITVPRATRLPPDFHLDDHKNNLAVKYWKSKDRPDLIARVQDIFNQFVVDAKAKGKKFEDWNSAWTTWYCNAVQFQRPPHANSYGNAKPNVADEALFAKYPHLRPQ